MKKTFLLLTYLFLWFNLSAQNKLEYLAANRTDLASSDYLFPQSDFTLVGFGALHGSAKTYDAELNVIKALKKQDLFEYYIVETNYSQAFYFQEYLNKGDDELLKQLTLSFQTMVSQEGTIETYAHWKNLRALHLKYPNNPIKVVGCDVVNEYRFPIKHLLALTSEDTAWAQREILKQVLNDKNADFSFWNQDIQQKVKSFVLDYRSNKSNYETSILDLEIFDHIIAGIGHNFGKKREREKIIFDNYMVLHAKLDLANKNQFAKYGYFHVQKNREGNYPSFFTRLIENKVYARDKVITIMCYLTKSKVLWDKVYDKNGAYKSFTTRAGFGVSDCWRESFKGIKNLKLQRISDQTIYRLNGSTSPYNNGTDLVELKVFLKDYNTTKLKQKNTLEFIDYAILISSSSPQLPLEEMK
ncbi:MAG: hypothetical protein ACJAQ2_000197 [Vicingaceae bacterium]|jgi:hypothetical protein